MDYSKNSNHNDTSCHSGIRDDRDNFTLNTCLRLLEGRKCMLEKNIGNYNRLKTEVRDLHIELEDLQQMTADTKNSYDQSFNDFNQDLEAKSLKHNEILSSLYELERTNQQLQGNIRSNTVQEIQMVEKIQKLEYDYAEFLEDSNKHQDTILNEKESTKLLKQQLCDLESVIHSKAEEANKLRCVLNDKEVALRFKKKKQITIQKQNDTTDQTVDVLTAEYQAQEAELVAFRKKAPERLIQAEQRVNNICQDLATVNAQVADWNSKAEQSIKMLSDLKASSEAELCCARSLLGKLIGERHLLTKKQSETSNQLEKVITNNCRLVADSKTMAERKACIAAKVEWLEQSKCCDRLALMLYRTKSDSEAVLHEDEMAVKWHTFTSIENEVESLRRACQDRESVIRDTKRQLDDCCSIGVKVCGSSTK